MLVAPRGGDAVAIADRVPAGSASARVRTMARSILRATSPIAGVGLMIAILTLAACGSAGTAAPSESLPASPAPSIPASPEPSQAPSGEPSGEPSGVPGDGSIRLDVADPHEVSVVVTAPDGVLRGAASGRAGDGMSVRWGSVEVENLDADTLRVTWVGLPQAGVARLALAANGDGYRLSLRQPAPPANSDAIGLDRVLVLHFAAPVNAEAVVATVAGA
jgi:hypothetical protein